MNKLHQRINTLSLLIFITMGLVVLSLGINLQIGIILRDNVHQDRTRVSLINYDCGQAAFTYKLMNYLVQDSSPHFGTPTGSPVVDDTRALVIQQLYKDEIANALHFKKQGCDITKQFNPQTLGIVK